MMGPGACLLILGPLIAPIGSPMQPSTGNDSCVEAVIALLMGAVLGHRRGTRAWISPPRLLGRIT